MSKPISFNYYCDIGTYQGQMFCLKYLCLYVVWFVHLESIYIVYRYISSDEWLYVSENFWNSPHANEETSDFVEKQNIKEWTLTSQIRFVLMLWICDYNCLLCSNSYILMLACWVEISADENLKYIFFYFFQKIGFVISCKLSLKETICMKCQSLLSGKKCWNFYPAC